jgi:hypothetical protein
MVLPIILGFKSMQIFTAKNTKVAKVAKGRDESRFLADGSE